MSKMSKSPYLYPTRLAEVIASIQVLGVYKFYKLKFDQWQRRIDGIPSDERAKHWETIFKEHPEFFRIDSKEQKASLVLRRTFNKLYNVDNGNLITRDVYETLTNEDRERISRRPLTSEEMLTLVNTATQLHDRAIAQRQERRWWFDLLIGLIGVIVGALAVVLGAWIQKGSS